MRNERRKKDVYFFVLTLSLLLRERFLRKVTFQKLYVLNQRRNEVECMQFRHFLSFYLEPLEIDDLHIDEFINFEQITDEQSRGQV
jgi:hypothetical protein